MSFSVSTLQTVKYYFLTDHIMFHVIWMVFVMKWIVSLYKQRTSDWVCVSFYTHSKDISPNAIAQQALNDCVCITYPLFDNIEHKKTND